VNRHMKKYKVKVTPEAKTDLKLYLTYVLKKLKNEQATKSIADDFRATKNELEDVAGSIRDPDSEMLKQRRLKRINLKHHNYFLLFRIKDDVVEVTNMFHDLEDYESKLR